MTNPKKKPIDTNFETLQMKNKLEGMNQFMVSLSGQIQGMKDQIAEHHKQFIFHQHNIILGTTPQFLNEEWHNKYLARKAAQEKAMPTPPPKPLPKMKDKK